MNWMNWMPENKALLDACNDWLDAINGKSVPIAESRSLERLLRSVADEVRLRAAGQSKELG